jgi:hypothetical protein
MIAPQGQVMSFASLNVMILLRKNYEFATRMLEAFGRGELCSPAFCLTFHQKYQKTPSQPTWRFLLDHTPCEAP